MMLFYPCETSSQAGASTGNFAKTGIDLRVGGDEGMNDVVAADHAGQPLFGDAALQDALAGFGVSTGAGDICFSEGDHASGAARKRNELPPKTVSQVLGEITWLMTQSPRHKAIPLGDLEWLLMPAILLRQFRIFYKGEQPVGVSLWALANDLVATRIDANDKRLTAAEWKSGTLLRIIDVVAPFGGEAEMRSQSVISDHVRDQ
jgi:cytolysin-activating lysine-acyltransferase